MQQKIFTLQMDSDTREALDALAQGERLSRAATLRRLVLAAAKRKALRPPAVNARNERRVMP